MPGQYEIDQVGQRQEIADIVTNVIAQDTSFVSMASKGEKPNQKTSKWQVETYPAPAHGGVKDGADVSSYEAVTRDELTGVAQKLRKPWFVSDFADVSEVAGLPAGEKGRQKAAAAIVLKMMMEARALCNLDCTIEVNGDPASVNATRGSAHWLEASAQTLFPVPATYRPDSACIYSSTLPLLTESAFQTALQAAYKAKRGKLDLDGFVGIELKTRMDNWTARDTEATSSAYPVRCLNQDAKDKALIKVVDFFSFSEGDVRVHPSSYLYLDVAGAATSYTHKSGLFLDLSKWSIRYMRKPGMRELEDQGGGPRGFSDTIMVLECLNPLGQVKAEISA